MMQIAIINQAHALDAAVGAWVAALQRQMTEHFEPVYAYGAKLRYVPKGEKPRPEEFPLYLADRAPADADYLGYHDQDEKGRPIGYVFLQTSINAGESPTVTLSHEVLELVANPFCDQAAMGPSAKRLLVAYEACDAVQGDTYKIDGIEVSNFVYPNYFGLGDPGPYDHMRLIKKPFEIRRGGYEIHAGADRQWVAADIKGRRVQPKHLGSRTAHYLRRSAPLPRWRRAIKELIG